MSQDVELCIGNQIFDVFSHKTFQQRCPFVNLVTRMRDTSLPKLSLPNTFDANPEISIIDKLTTTQHHIMMSCVCNIICTNLSCKLY